MLVLTRIPSESILIGDSITVRVESVRGNQVKLAIDGPREVAIDREEVRWRKTHGVAPDAAARARKELNAPVHRKPKKPYRGGGVSPR